MSSFSNPISNYLPRFIFSRIKLKKSWANYNTKIVAQLLESLCLLAQGKDKTGICLTLAILTYNVKF